MAHYLLSVHSVAAAAPAQPMTGEQVRQMMQDVDQLEKEMASAGAWVFGGKLSDPDTATTVRTAGDDVLMTDGPFAESKEHLGGFYVIAAEDLDAALSWASKVTTTIGAPIEVRPFAHVSGA
jgi:hypothetical protein